MSKRDAKGRFIIRDLKGQRFGRLVVIRISEDRTKGGHILWLCICDCNNITKVSGNDLKRGRTQSCGCLQKERTIEHSIQHGDSKPPTRLYVIWRGMRKRCHDSKDKNYEYYGGKGIVVCKEWKNNYLSFKKWSLNNGYTDNLTIDRINHDGNYEPSNCQWITASENSRKACKDRKSKQSLTIKGVQQ